MIEQNELDEIVECFVTRKDHWISFLQRKLSIGYMTAYDFLQRLIADNIVEKIDETYNLLDKTKFKEYIENKFVKKHSQL